MDLTLAKRTAYTAIIVAATVWPAIAQDAPVPAQPPLAQSAQPATAQPGVDGAKGEGSNGPAVPVPSSLPGSTERALLQAGPSNAVRALKEFKDSDVKFDVSELMDILRDRRHEGWVLAAYPDPRTGQPLIGAGFTLDLPEREHLQHDPLNSHPFIEPSSADLWQAAGLAPAKLSEILRQFDAKNAQLGKKKFRRQIHALEPQITDDDAGALLRIAIIQAAYNARGYCRNFDQLTPSQQMAMTQLVYQMGVNLQRFSGFLEIINRDTISAHDTSADDDAARKADADYWRSVQVSLVQSQWARLYRERAKAVIAMLDPSYLDDPSKAEHSVSDILRPAPRARARVRTAAYSRRRPAAARKRAARTRKN